MRDVGDEAAESAESEMARGTEAPPPEEIATPGSETLGMAERRTCHSGSSHFHSVVFLRREWGSDLVGEGT